VFLHVDLTDQRKLPVQRDRVVGALRRRGAYLWNPVLPDLSKGALQAWNRRLSLPSTSAPRAGPAAELLIVKTQHNCFGATECQLTAEERAALGYPRAWSTPIDGEPDYPVLHRRDVPDRWWRSHKLSIERYICNGDGDFFRVLFFGAHAVFTVCRSHAAVKRPEETLSAAYLLLERPVRCGLLGPLLAMAFRNATTLVDAIGLGYGAVDLVADRSVAYIVDVNPTPSWNGSLDAVLRKHLLAGAAAWRNRPGSG
jgi:hypothetical protein